MTSSSMVVAVVAADAVTAACGVFNAAYFLRYRWRPLGRRARRVAASALVLVNAAAVSEAGLSQWLLWWEQGVVSIGPQATPLGALLRLPLLAATAAISIIIARRLAS